MRFSLSPPPPKATSATTSPTMHSSRALGKGDEELTETADDAASDYKQWLHAMKLVARLPGGMPPEFRRKLWLSLADKYLKSKNVEWAQEEEKCFCEKWREDDEELGIQIVKDLHRTGSNLCTGPAGSINQAKLKRILLGYARYNTEVGYCQGFNMLGALILQVMDKEEAESMKVMIYLVEGVLPPGYFCGSMGGLQADMGVFRELMTSKLPRLAKHLQKLQGPIENAYEPPLTNVFTMQWFLTMFCTCLPMTCVLRVWDLVLIEGSDVLLRTALVLWSLLEERILSARTADDFYCKMGSFSSELLNGHLIDSNGLIEKVVQLGPIPDIQRLRDKHLYNIAPLRHKQGLQLYFDDEEPESDEESRLAVATVWGIPWGRRGSTGQATINKQPLQPENKDRIALDISLLKKQYDRLRERQKQAHIILTTACSTAARQSTINTNQTLPVNNLLMGRSAIVTNKGRRIGPPPGAIPPARKPSLPAVLQTTTKPVEKQLRRGETLHWRDTDISKRRRDSLTWKEIRADRSASRDSSEDMQPHKLRTRLGKSDSSSYSDESDGEEEGEGSSTDTSLCDEDDGPTTAAEKHHKTSASENSPKKRSKTTRKQKELSCKLREAANSRESSQDRMRPKSWAPTNDEIPFVLMTSDSPLHSSGEKSMKRRLYDEITMKEEEDSATESDRVGYKLADNLQWTGTKYSPIAGDLATTKLDPLLIQTDILELPVITSTSQLSPMPDITNYLKSSSISPMPTPKPIFLDSTNSLGSGDGEEAKNFDVSDDGVTNEYFERVNSVERPTKLDLFYSLSEEDCVRNAYQGNDDEPLDDETNASELHEIKDREIIEGCEASDLDEEKYDGGSKERIRMELLDDYSEKSSVACIAEATSEVSSGYSKQKEMFKQTQNIEDDLDLKNDELVDIKKENRKLFHRKYSLSETSKKRRDPRRLTIARSYTIETADNYQILDRHQVFDIKEEGKGPNHDCTPKNALLENNTKVPSANIPSTADLEDRFNRLEKQLSESRKCVDSSTNLNILEDKTSCENKKIYRHDTTEDQDFIEAADKNKCEDMEKVNRTCIPTTAELEDRFSALEKQLSAESAQAKGLNELNKSTNADERVSKKLNEKSEIGNKILLESNIGKVLSEHEINVTDNELNSLHKETIMVSSESNTCSDSRENVARSKDILNLHMDIEGSINLHLPTNAVLKSRFSALTDQINDTVPDDMQPENKKNTLESKTNDMKIDQNIVMVSLETKPETPTEQNHASAPEDLLFEMAKEDVIPQTNVTESDQTVITASLNSKSEALIEGLEAVLDLQHETTPIEGLQPEKNPHDEQTILIECSPDIELISHTEFTKSHPEKNVRDLEKQLSSESINTKENIILNKNTRHAENAESADKDKNERLPRESNKPAKTSDSKTGTHNEAEAEVTQKADTKPRLAKIPSTAELEDRFNALERKKSLSKNSPPKTKKKPPDETENDTEKHAEDRDEEILEEKPGPSKNKNSNDDPVNNKISLKNKTPPSTEELEKRFKAFEMTLTDEPKTKTEDHVTNTTRPSDSVKSFNEKCKAINLSIREKESTKKSEQEEEEVLKEPKINKKLSENSNENKTKPAEVVEFGKTKHLADIVHIRTTRRASEPPTTDDLETRYEAFKRRMSTRTITEKDDKKRSMVKSETVEEALERIEKEVLDEAIDIVEVNIPIIEKTEVISKVSPESIAIVSKKELVTRRASEPPTTEELEKRFEKLKRRLSTTTEISSEENNKKQVEMTIKKSPVRTSVERDPDLVNAPKSQDSSRIPVPPPMQTKHLPLDPSEQNHRRALVRELQSKMIPNDENLKPSNVNPNRKISKQRARMTDETSETLATTASMRLKNYEPWHMQPQKMVRRFSDLPSRADLENRVNFLEQQLSLKYIKQRSASDSEVASRTKFVELGGPHEKPTTSAKSSRSNDLEHRVMALEKQLSENSLKLVEAMRQRSKEHNDYAEEESKNAATEADSDSKTGLELVRYSHYGEIEETETTKPINISINIKMHLNKETEQARKKTMSLPTTQELEKRLEALEEHVSRPAKATSEAKGVILEENKTVTNTQMEEANRKTEEIVVADKAILLEKKTIEEKASTKIKRKQETEIDKWPSSVVAQKTAECKQTTVPKAMKDDLQTAESKNTDFSKDLNVEIPQKQFEDLKRGDDNKQIIEDKKILSKDVDATKTAASTIAKTEKDITSVETVTSNVEVTEVTTKLATANQGEVENAPKQDIQHAREKGEKNLAVENTTRVLSKELEIESTKAPELVTANPNEFKVDSTDNKNMVLLLDNEPKAVKVRRLTRANTEELEDLLQALEKQLNNRNLIKSEDGKLIRADSLTQPTEVKTKGQADAISNLSKEIQEFTNKNEEKQEKSAEKHEYDWGPDPVKRHLKRSTVYLPSTKELESRYRSLERQIRLLEDVEKIDVEQRLNEIERKIKLQYSLSHEKDLNKYLELCEGKLPDDEPAVTTPKRNQVKSQYTSPSRSRERTPCTSPTRNRKRTPHTSPSQSRGASRSPYTSPAGQRHAEDERLPTTDDLEYRYRVLDLVRSKSKDSLSGKSKPKPALKKQPIHPLEMLLDSSPVESDIPTTGELEHRMRVLDGRCQSPSPPRKSRQRSHSPTVDDIIREKMIQERRPKTPIHSLETMVVSPTKRALPTEEELEARMRALEDDQRFDFKMQKNYKEFNQKLRAVISPSLSFEEFKATKSREQSPKRPVTPKSALKDHEVDYERDEHVYRSTSPKMIRFREDEERRSKSSLDHHDAGKMVGTSDGVVKIIEENSLMLHHILKKTLADSNSSSFSETSAGAKGLEVQGPYFLRETSPIRRTGTHTGVPLRTDDNINDRLNSIKNTIKSIDTLCEEKPYRKEKCQRYIDSLFTDSVYFASPSKKASLEDLTYKRRSGDYAPSIRVSDHSQRPSEYYLSRSMGSADSIRSTSPLRAASPLHHRSTRDLRRDVSPRSRRRIDEDREEYDSRVRTRANLLPNFSLDDSNESISRSSLTKFYKVDNELDKYKFDDKARSSSRSASRSPLRSPYGSREMMINTDLNNITTLNNTTTTSSKRLDLDRPVSPYRQTSHNLLGYDSSLSHTKPPVYNPAKLEIRHTTVTSTFYDRLLTEKQIEKSLSRPPSRSPIVSPSVTSRSYLDIPTGSSVICPKSSGNSPLTPVHVGSIGFGNYSSALSTTTTTTSSISNTYNTTATTSTGNSSAYLNSNLARLPPVTDCNSTDRRIRSCDNILMQLKSSPVGAAAFNTVTTAITTATTTNNYTTFFNTVSTGAFDTATTTTSTTNNATHATYSVSSAGEYNPLLPLNLRPPPEIGIQLGNHNTSTLNNNSAITSSMNFYQS